MRATRVWYRGCAQPPRLRVRFESDGPLHPPLSGDDLVLHGPSPPLLLSNLHGFDTPVRGGTQAGAIKVFTDVRSGRAMIRPGLDALLAYARAGDMLAVVCLDRLGRSLSELLSTVTMLKERGIALLSLEEKLDTSSAAGELVFHVFGAIAHFERRLIAERTKDGIAAARARGKLPGR